MRETTMRSQVPPGGADERPLRVLVTGVKPDGIGGAICRKLMADALVQGRTSRLTMSATQETPELAVFADELRDGGASVLVSVGDLSSAVFPVTLAQEAIAFADGLDILVSNAGNTRLGILNETSLDDWESLFAVHARAAWLLASTALPALRESGGSFVATASTSGVHPHPGLSAYSPAKAALIMLVKTLALEWGPVGVRVNAVSPGPIHTPMWGEARKGVAPEDLARLAKERADALPLRAVGEPKDIAEAVAFLAGPSAKFITGVNLCVDGGLTLVANESVPMRHRQHV
ncbi:SDR family NAD(P)-dependent oxidoreductase [Nocardioides sp. NPDC051685]|uniref:SDR family NAD(P)-dependent oxidoreductase n=1 Tax=Nocardioides sp. NPDC051685 TaxID=3364334 RepID=UPI0037A73C41